MIIILIGLCTLGAWEAYVYRLHRYTEDLLLSFISFGTAMFLTALMTSGVIIW